MDTRQEGEGQERQPSAAQLNGLMALQAARPLLLQYHFGQHKTSANSAVPQNLESSVKAAGGRMLSAAAVDLLAIGQATEHPAHILLAEFPGPASVYEHISSASMADLLQQAGAVEIIVATAPSRGMRRIISLLNRLLPLLPAPRRGRDMPEEELRGGINPTPQQFADMQKADQTRPIHMFNLLKFHDRARYADGDRGRTGRQAYEKGYGQVAMNCVLRLGGRIVALGRYRLTLVGANGDPAPTAWDEIAVIQYPGRPAFVRMVSSPYYLAALEHRHAGLKSTLVWSSTPAEAYC